MDRHEFVAKFLIQLAEPEDYNAFQEQEEETIIAFINRQIDFAELVWYELERHQSTLQRNPEENLNDFD